MCTLNLANRGTLGDRNSHSLKMAARSIVEGRHPSDPCEEALGSGGQARQGKCSRGASQERPGNPCKGWNEPDPVVHERMQELRESGKASATARRAWGKRRSGPRRPVMAGRTPMIGIQRGTGGATLDGRTPGKSRLGSKPMTRVMTRRSSTRSKPHRGACKMPRPDL